MRREKWERRRPLLESGLILLMRGLIDALTVDSLHFTTSLHGAFTSDFTHADDGSEEGIIATTTNVGTAASLRYYFTST